MNQSSLTCSLCRRAYATEAPIKSHLRAAALVSRPPLLLSPPSAFERAYRAWSRRMQRAISLPVNHKMYLRPGSSAERQFLEREEQLRNLGQNEEDGEHEPEATTKELGQTLPISDVKRKASRTLYLLLRRDRERHQWQFPQGDVADSDETLVDAALRGLKEDCGPHLDIWPVGTLPAASYSYMHASTASSAYDGRETVTFFSPMHVLRGQVQLDDASSKVTEERIVEHAWLTKEEIKERLNDELWQAVEPVLLAR